jgi:hypothetical protein
VKTTDGKVYKGDIDSYLRKQINFTKIIEELGDNSIPIEKVVEIRGEMPVSRINAILKSNKNIKFYDLLNERVLQSGDNFEYTDVVQVEGISKKQLFNRAKMWIATYYRSSSDVLQIVDEENGQIVGKALIEYHSSVYKGSEATKGYIRYKISIFFKDGRYKYSFSNFIHEGNPFNDGPEISFGLITNDEECPIEFNNILIGAKWRDNVWNDIKDKVDAEMKGTVESLKTSMNKTIAVEEDEW